MDDDFTQADLEAEIRGKVEDFLVRTTAKKPEVAEALGALLTARPARGERRGCDRVELGIRLAQCAEAYRLKADEVYRLGLSRSRFDGLPGRVSALAADLERVHRSSGRSEGVGVEPSALRQEGLLLRAPEACDTIAEARLLDHVRRKTGRAHYREVGLLLKAVYLLGNPKRKRVFGEDELKKRIRPFRTGRKLATLGPAAPPYIPTLL